MKREDVLAYLIVLNDDRTLDQMCESDDFNIGLSHMLGCLMRVIDQLEEKQDFKTLELLRRRETLNGLNLSTNNYEKNYIYIARDVYRQFPCIKEFFFNQVFEIPKNFDFKKQELTVAGDSEVISVLNLYKQIARSGQDAQTFLAGKRVNKNAVELADFHSGKLEVIFADGESKQFDFNQNIELSAA